MKTSSTLNKLLKKANLPLFSFPWQTLYKRLDRGFFDDEGGE